MRPDWLPLALRVGLRAGQFSLLSLTLGLLAVVVGRRRPTLGGVLLGLSLVKLHVGGAVLLWALLTRRVRLAAVAVAVCSGGVLLFSLRLGESPIVTCTSWSPTRARPRSFTWRCWPGPSPRWWRWRCGRAPRRRAVAGALEGQALVRHADRLLVAGLFLASLWLLRADVISPGSRGRGAIAYTARRSTDRSAPCGP